jgi:hypothetical protein
MRITRVQPGDIVRTGGMMATVTQKHVGALTVKGLVNGSTRRIGSRDVEAVWLRHPRPGRTT